MDGDALDAVERRPADSTAFSLPSVLARLDADEPAEQRAAVETIHGALPERPGDCIPTVPKLRALLEQPALDCHESVAYCLAELAAESPDDVAPSVDVIVSFVEAHPESPATHELLRCLATVAAERPDALAEHVAAVADALDRRPGYDRWGLHICRTVSTAEPTALEPAVPVLADALAADPEAHGTLTLPTLGRLARASPSPPSLAFVDRAAALVAHDDDGLRNNAIGCLADVAAHNPAAVDSAGAALADALECDDPRTRSNAAVAIARLARAREDDDLDARAREPLLALLDDDHERARANACVALGRARVESAADRLATLANEDPSPEVRERAAWALTRVS